MTMPSYLLSDVFQCSHGLLVVVLPPSRIKRQILTTVSLAPHSLTHLLTQKWVTHRSTAFVRTMGKGTWTSPPASKEAYIIWAQKMKIWRRVETRTLLAMLQYSLQWMGRSRRAHAPCSFTQSSLLNVGDGGRQSSRKTRHCGRCGSSGSLSVSFLFSKQAHRNIPHEHYSCIPCYQDLTFELRETRA